MELLNFIPEDNLTRLQYAHEFICKREREKVLQSDKKLIL